MVTKFCYYFHSQTMVSLFCFFFWVMHVHFQMSYLGFDLFIQLNYNRFITILFDLCQSLLLLLFFIFFGCFCFVRITQFRNNEQKKTKKRKAQKNAYIYALCVWKFQINYFTCLFLRLVFVSPKTALSILIFAMFVHILLVLDLRTFL